jgi:hypothetical protein
VGGGVIIRGADGGATSGNGGQVQLAAGDCIGSGTNGGNVNLFAGDSTGTTGGSINATTGNGTIIGGDFQITLQTGDGSNVGNLAIRQSTGGTVAPAIELPEARNNGVNYLSIKAPNSLTTSPVWTIPEAQQTSGDPLGIDLGEYTVATLPSASTYPNCWAVATDGGSPDQRQIVRSDGTNWRVIAIEGEIVSAGP